MDPSQYSRRFQLGTTPVNLARVINYEVEVELAGYMKTTVRIPGITGHDLGAPCNLTVVLTETTASP